MLSIEKAYCVISAKTNKYDTVGGGSVKSDLYETAINGLVGMNPKFLSVSNYVYGGDHDEADTIHEYVNGLFTVTPEIIVLTLMELQKQRPFSERQIAEFLNISRTKYRKHYKKTYRRTLRLLEGWLDEARSYYFFRQREKNE